VSSDEEIDEDKCYVCMWCEQIGHWSKNCPTREGCGPTEKQKEQTPPPPQQSKNQKAITKAREIAAARTAARLQAESAPQDVGEEKTNIDAATTGTTATAKKKKKKKKKKK
jgi:hypothetical protein